MHGSGTHGRGLLFFTEGDEREALKQRMEDRNAADTRKREEASLVNGPQLSTEGEGIVSNQDQVDDLLDELGF